MKILKNSCNAKFGIKVKVVLLLLLIPLVLDLAGCEPLRKKFTRKKRAEKTSEFIPVLDPIDYAERQESAQGRYQYHYSVWKMWHQDLMTAYNEESPQDKKLLYNIEQMLAQFQEMQVLLKGEKKERIQKNMNVLNDIKAKVADTTSLHNDYILKSKLMALGKEMRRDFKPDKLVNDFIQ